MNYKPLEIVFSTQSYNKYEAIIYVTPLGWIVYLIHLGKQVDVISREVAAHSTQFTHILLVFSLLNILLITLKRFVDHVLSFCRSPSCLFILYSSILQLP